MRGIRNALLILAVAANAHAASAGWFTDEVPPANAKPLSEIIKMVEDKGFKVITEVEFDDGVWKIETQQPDGKEVHIKIDPVTGQQR